MQNAMHVPMLVSGSTFQHIDETSQLSMPLTPEPSTVHSSPTDAGAGSSGEQRVAFQALPPSFAHGMHFSPSGQSCAQISHSMLTPPPSGGVMKPMPVIVPLPVVSPPVLDSASVVIDVWPPSLLSAGELPPSLLSCSPVSF